MATWQRHWWWCAAIVVAGYKLALLRSQHFFAIGNAHHDEGLFIKLAQYLVRGEWLGPYDQLTLAKGPVYSLFIAANFKLGLPLALTQQLLYVLACALVIRALAPRLKTGWAKLLAFTFLVYNPLTYEGETMTRLLRQHLTVPLALIIAAAVVALVLRRQERWTVRMPWAMGGGLAWGLFTLTREEGIWIVPLLGLAGGALLVESWRRGRPEFWHTIGLLGVMMVMAYGPVLAVSVRNHLHYGWWGTVDFRAGDFKDAVGALTRVKVGPQRPYVQVSPEARTAIYAVSPAFAQLQPHLEDGPIALKWMEKRRHSFEERIYMTGWFHWALRDAIAAAGHAETPRQFLTFCARLAAEVNAACDDGRLAAAGPRSGFLPRWHAAYGEAMQREWRRFLAEVGELKRFETIVPPSVGTDDEIRAFVDLSYDNLSPSRTASYFHKPDQLEQNRWKLDRLRALADTWRGWFRWLFQVAGGLLLIRVLERSLRRRWSWEAWLAVAVVATAAAQLLINFLVHTMAFENLYPAAFAPAYALMQLAACLVFLDVARAWVMPAGRWGWRRIRTRLAGSAKDAPTGESRG